ncbi:MAG: SMR family transporter [Candidatus Gracilibacteria bacterium]|nr:SMR family transporter [Candidatus Gracilibacteria bacterium]
MESYILLGLAVVSNAVGNIFMKLSSEQFSESLKEVLINPWVIFQNGLWFLGIACFGLTLVVYTKVLSQMNLSVAYPIMTSLGFVIVVMFSVLYLGERLAWWQWLGLLCVMIGVFLLSQGNSHG